MPETLESKKAVNTDEMVFIAGGKFMMGSENFYPEEKPVHEVTVDGFYIDQYEVTNEDYKKFTDETGYITVAERPLNAADYPGADPARVSREPRRGESSRRSGDLSPDAAGRQRAHHPGATERIEEAAAGGTPRGADRRRAAR